MSSTKSTKSQFLSGRDLAIQLGEIALYVCSPIAREMIWEAEAGDFLDEDWVVIAILNQLLDDTLNVIKERSHIVTIETMIKAIMRGEHKDVSLDSENLDDSEEDNSNE